MSVAALTMRGKKYRSIDSEYIHTIVREYERWTLMVSDNQNYLGRMVIWLMREGTMQLYSSLSNAELLELQQVIRDAEFGLHALWAPDHMNYAWLGNLFHEHGGHGHMHLIPRYRKSRWYRGRAYEDKRWGQNFSPCDAYKPDTVTLHAMRDDLKKALA